jgi:hypothetical protein
MLELSNKKQLHFVTAVHAGLKASEIALQQAERTNALMMEHGQRHADMMHGHYAALAEIHDPGHFFQHMYEHVANGYAHAADAVKDFFSLSHEFHHHYVSLAGDQMNATQQEVGSYMRNAFKETHSVHKVSTPTRQPRTAAKRTRGSARKR